MACVDVCCFDAAVFVDADCAHEAEGVFDCVDGFAVLFFYRGGDDVPEAPV